ncbi:MAG TPA: hypothetical protein VFR15_10460 [Chloroflexia bacterium]|nr:hypothetical protein [Chloroflexia bacterium]
MESPSILPGIALRTAWYTLAVEAALGAAYSALLFVVAVVGGIMNDFRDGPILGGSGLSSEFSKYDPSNLDKIGAAGTIPAALAAVFVGIVIGGFAGSILGGISGAVAGLVTGAITSAAFYPITYGNLRRFQTTITAVGVGVSTVVAFLLGPYAFRMLVSARAGSDAASWLIQALLPALLAGVGAWWASYHVTEWYEGEYLDSSERAVG